MDDANSLPEVAPSKARGPVPTGVRGLLASVRRDSDVASRLRPKTVPLLPVYWQDGSAGHLTSLLVECVGTAREATTPWGTITWQWPDGSFESLDDWGSALPSGLEVGRWLLPQDRKARGAALDALDAVQPSGEVPSADEVDQRIAEALPEGAMDWYRAVLPGRLRQAGPATRSDGTPSATPPRVAIRDIARTAETLAASAGLEEVAERLRQFLRERGRNGSRVAVLGECNRGKSTLVNQLLGRQILPNAHTVLTVVVQAGTPEGLDILWPDGRQERRALDQDAWVGLTSGPGTMGGQVADGRSTQPPPQLRVLVDAPWLKQLELELIDTVGPDHRPDSLFQIRQAVACSEAVIFAISGSSPLSLSERMLLEEEVLLRHVPHVLVVVTKLNQLEPSEREIVLDYLIQRAHEVSPTIVVLPGPGLREPDVTALDQLRAVISDVTSATGQIDRRDKRLALQVADECRAIIATATAAGENLVRDAKDKQAEIDEAKHSVSSAALGWDQLRFDFERRKLRAVASLRELIRGSAAEVADSLTVELLRVPDPKAWWEGYLPVRLRRELRSLTQSFETSLSGVLERDVAWLDEQVTTRFGSSGLGGQRVGKVNVEPQDLDELTLTDLEPRRAAARVANALGRLIGAGIAFAAGAGSRADLFMIGGSALAELIGERQLNAATAEQRDQVLDGLHRVLDDVFSQYSSKITAELERAYRHVLADLHRAKQSWQAAQLRTISATGDYRPDAEWQRIAASAHAILTSIPPGLAEAGYTTANLEQRASERGEIS